jgi:cold shock CspA family protein
LVPPELVVDAEKFDIVLHHRSVFSPKDQEWLRAYEGYNLSRDEQRAILLGRDGHLLSTNEIVKALGIIDTDQFRQLIEQLRRKGILYNALQRGAPTRTALRAAGTKRDVGRYAIRPPDQTEQYREELIRVLTGLGPRALLSAVKIKSAAIRLSSSSPYKENPIQSLKLLGLVDEKMRPLPLLSRLWEARATTFTAPAAAAPVGKVARLAGKIVKLNAIERYGFIRATDGVDYFFHSNDLADARKWTELSVGAEIAFEISGRVISGKRPAAKNVEPKSR